MTRAELPNARILGRPFKPLAVGLIMASGFLGMNQFLVLMGFEPLVSTPSGSIGGIGLAAVFSVLGMIVSWIVNWQVLYKYSLLLCMGAWVARGFSQIMGGEWALAVFPLAFAMMAGGSYILETVDEFADIRWDPRGKAGVRAE